MRRRARKLKHRVGALIIALQDARTPWYAKLCGAAVVAYAVSPIDLVPDFIPILGLLDDLVLLPLGILITIRLIPRPVFLSALRRSWRGGTIVTPRLKRFGVGAVVALWLIVALVIVRILAL